MVFYVALLAAMFFIVLNFTKKLGLVPRRVGCKEDLLIPLPVLSESYALA